MLKSIQQAILILSFLNTTRDEYNYEPTSGSLVFMSPRYRHLFCSWDMRSFARSHRTLLPIKGSTCSKTSLAFLPAQIKTAIISKAVALPSLPNPRNSVREVLGEQMDLVLPLYFQRPHLWQTAAEALCHLKWIKLKNRNGFAVIQTNAGTSTSLPSPPLPIYFPGHNFQSFSLWFSYNEIHWGENREVFEGNYKLDRLWLFKLF